jgi:hypothetical protein
MQGDAARAHWASEGGLLMSGKRKALTDARYREALTVVVTQRQRELRLRIEGVARKAKLTCEELAAVLNGERDATLLELRRLAHAVDLELPALLEKTEAEARATRAPRRWPRSRNSRR